MLNKAIRKISVGSDVNNQLHISVGSEIGDVTVETIVEVDPSHYEVYVKRGEGIFIWKTIVDMPVIVEYNTRLR